MQHLPIDPHLPRIAETLRDRGALVLIGPPGCGKTTRVPPAILERGLRGPGRILVLQPRRIAARAAAARIARERGWSLGREVGYTVRFENRSGRDTRIQVVTEGILTRRLQSDPFLDGVGAVVLDEFHERSIHSDLALALLREIRRSGREDLRLLVMSATLDPGPVSAYLGGCPTIEVEGRPHPVEIRHVEASGSRDPAGIARSASDAVRGAWDGAAGHALVFLPGIGEIRRAMRDLEPFARERGALLLPLHGGLSLEEQERALDPTPERKIVLSTNVAETSLTIEGVDLVVDGGWARVLRNDPRHGIDRLELVRVSRHSADQRAGRAGRVGPGKAVRLWSVREHATLADSEAPEIRRVDLASTVLELRAWGVARPETFEWLEAPEPEALARAEELLAALGAVAGPNGPLTPIGKAMLEIPAHPRISRMVVAARNAGVLREACLAAAILEERDVVPMAAGPERPGGPGRGQYSVTGPSDILLRMDLVEEAERRGFRRADAGRDRLDLQAARAVARARDALLRSAGAEPRGAPGLRRATEDEAILRVLLLGFPDRVVRRRARGSDRGRMTGGRGVVLAPDSVVRDAELFLALDLDENVRGERLEARVNVASAVRREWIEEDFGPFVAEAVRTFWDDEAGKARSTATVAYRDLPLEEPRDVRSPPDEAERILAEVARARAVEIFAGDEPASAWLGRVRSLAGWLPELGLPAFDPPELGGLLAASCGGRSSLAELRALDLRGLLRSRLSRDQARAVDEHAPPALKVPSGREVLLVYEAGRPPVLAVRLQELFGLHDTPRVAAGRVAVLLHILGPNYRPVQVTQDLRSFWSTTYAQVRKDLRARYPKHAWPEDPWTAAPSRR